MEIKVNISLGVRIEGEKEEEIKKIMEVKGKDELLRNVQNTCISLIKEEVDTEYIEAKAELID